MKNLRIYNKLTVAVLGVILSTLFIACNREEDELPKAGFPEVGDIFTNDSFIGLGTNFFFPFIDGGAKPDVFTVDMSEGYQGTSSIRIDVPDADDPGGSFAGAGFIIDGVGRNLTQYNALTFWARASESATINEFGFGVNATGNQYQTAATGLKFTTNWKQFIIPIPDASKLVNEKGMMWFAAPGVCPSGEGDCFPENPNGGTKKGFTFWLDEIKYENLGTIGQPRVEIQNGDDAVVAAFVGQVLEVSGVNVSFNMPNGIDLDLITTSAFFDYQPSESGVVSTAGSTLTVVGEGTTTITAKMGDVDAAGSLTVQTVSKAPEPTRDAGIVTSIFSDSYENAPVDFFNGFFGGQTTLGGAVETAPGNNILNYSNLNFVIAEFKNPTIDASTHTHMHVDVFTFDDTDRAELIIGLGDFGEDNAFGGGNDGRGDFKLRGSGFKSGEWISLDIRIDEFVGLNSRANLAQLVFESPQIDNLIADNIYFYSESPAQDASLSSITVNGIPIDGFASGILNYPVELPSSGIVPEIMGTTSNEDAQVVVTPAASVPGTTTLTVTAANGVTTQTYSIELVATDIADVMLSDLQVDGMTISDFSPSVMNYAVQLADGTTMAPAVSATANDDMATLSITDASGVPGTASVVVTGRDGVTQRTYSIAFSAGEAQGPVELIKNGGFDSDGDWTGNAFNIQEDGGSRFNFANVEVAGNPFDVNMSQTVTLVPGLAYTLRFEASTSAETGSRTMVVGIGQSADPFFADTETVTLTAQAQTFTLELTASDDGTGNDFGDATSRVLFDMGADVGVVVIDNVSLLGGSGGSTSGPTLSDLQVDGSTVTGFSGSTTSYTVELTAGTTTVPSVTATASDANATVEVNDATAIPGATTVVVSDNGSQTTYTVEFTVPAGPVELIKNGGFDSDGDWTGNAFNIQEDGGSRFNFADVGVAGNSFDVNMSQTVTLIPGASYTMTFEASTSAERGTRTMIVGIGQSADPFFANTQTITLTAQSQTFTLDLTATDDGTGSDFGDATSRVLFDMGADTGVIVIDNVSLIRK
ncbi:MAG: hypothetical protein RIF33_00635 [Cyclobacteriaceae bacterium]